MTSKSDVGVVLIPNFPSEVKFVLDRLTDPVISTEPVLFTEIRCTPAVDNDAVSLPNDNPVSESAPLIAGVELDPSTPEIPLVPSIVIAMMIFTSYTTTRVELFGTVNVTPLLIVMGPTANAFFPLVIV